MPDDYKWPPRETARMTDEELQAELDQLGRRWDDFRKADEDDVGHGGSPGEWMYERMGELETAIKRRKEKRDAVKTSS